MSSSPQPDAFTALVRLLAGTLGYAGVYLLVRRLLGVPEDVTDVETVMVLHGAGCTGFVVVATLLPPTARLGSARGLPSGVLAYVAFLAAWVPLMAFAYPALLRAFAVEFEPQPHLAHFADADWSRWQAVAFAATIVTVGPWMEELAFRGHIRDALRALAGPAAGLFGSALFFGLLHGAVYALPIGLLGLLLGWLRERTGGLTVPVVVHVLHNVTAIAIALAFPDAFQQVFR